MVIISKKREFFEYIYVVVIIYIIADRLFICKYFYKIFIGLEKNFIFYRKIFLSDNLKSVVKI